MSVKLVWFDLANVMCCIFCTCSTHLPRKKFLIWENCRICTWSKCVIWCTLSPHVPIINKTILSTDDLYLEIILEKATAVQNIQQEVWKKHYAGLRRRLTTYGACKKYNIPTYNDIYC